MSEWFQTTVDWICQNAQTAPYFLFGCLMLAGFNLPLSEDLILITGGMIAASCMQEGTQWIMIVVLYFGCIFSGWIAYTIGRLLGPKLYSIPVFRRWVSPERVDRLKHYLEKYGVWTFLLFRYVPGGIRNGLYMSSGLTHMPFHKFVLRDGFACIFSTTFLFSIGYFFAARYKEVLHFIKTYDIIVISLLILVVMIVFLLYKRNKRQPFI